ncbi:MAG TPA: hypothetical protein VMT87_07410 [Vicinamibacteria bacterium]|nr:hypothetical protein [Vicinamibacteria bacterium]
MPCSFILLAAVPAFAQSTYQPLIPDHEAGAPTYLNAEVVRVNAAAGSVTLRSERGDVVVTADEIAVAGLAGLRTGDKVLAAYSTIVDQSGRKRLVVTYARPASPDSGEPGPSAAAPTTTSSSTELVLSTDRPNRSVPMLAPQTVGGPGASPEVAGANAGTTGSTGAAGLPLVGGVAVPSVGATSPYARSVPSVSAPERVITAVLPPATAKAPLGDEDVGALRPFGERDFDAAVMVLAVAASDIDAAWFRYKAACLGGFVPETTAGREWFLLLQGRVNTPDDDQCRATHAQIMGTATGWDAQMGIALDAARRADVLPGRVRETLERHRLGR